MFYLKRIFLYPFLEHYDCYKVGSVRFKLLKDDLNLKFYFKGQKAGILEEQVGIIAAHVAVTQY